MLKKLKKKLIEKKNINFFCNFNKKKFFKNKIFSKSEILVEFNAFQPFHVGASLISNLLSQKYQSKINSYYGHSLLVSDWKYSFFKRLKWNFLNKLNLGTFKIYKSFNVEKIFLPQEEHKMKDKNKILYKKFLKKIRKKEDILKLKIKKIPIGDLLYDTYLKKNYLPTIDITSDDFLFFLKNFIKLTNFWINYFKKNRVRAVIGSHAVYSLAIPLRVAAFKNIPAYVLDLDHLYKVEKNKLFRDSDRYEYKEILSKILKKKELINAQKIAKENLNGRILGKTGTQVGMTTISKSSFKNNNKKRIILPSNRIKVLICAHEFFDSPHLYGDAFYPDFYEWLNFLGKASKNTSYDWYIKCHTRQDGKFKIYQPFTEKKVEEFLKLYKKIKLLPHDTSHVQLKKEGIDFVLTVHGSVHFEYPYLNVPVIAASKSIPSINFKFCKIPKSKKDYERIIYSLKNFSYSFDEKEILKYYYVRFVHNNSLNWLLDYNKALKKFKRWDLLFDSKFYEYYISNYKVEDFDHKEKIYLKFLNSNFYRLNNSIIKNL